jgi:urease accessory protein
MTWHATLAVDYTRQSETTVARFRHSGPLRILQSLYPEGSGICHNVIVHPPGGLVGGDTLDLRFSVGEGAHGLVTTPGATRFYRSDGPPALQRAHLTLAGGARLEWLPLEAICYSGCLAENHLVMNLAPGSELIGWDLTALGLPGAQLPFDKGSYLQHIEAPGVWLERARIRADDSRLMRSPLGLAGHACFASMFLAAGDKLTRTRRQRALDVAREVIAAHALQATAGATSPDARVVVVRVLAPVVEPVAVLLRQVREAWRRELWAMVSCPPRIWAM